MVAMPIILCTDTQALSAHAVQRAGDGSIILLTSGGSSLAAPLAEALANKQPPHLFLEIDIHSGRLNRLDFDSVDLIIVDLPKNLLLAAVGRRLTDALGRLATESLALAFTAQSTTAAGALLEDSVTAGLNLIPRTIILPTVASIPDLHTLLNRISRQGLRILALDGSVAAQYIHTDDSITVAGSGSALLGAFQESRNGQPTARLQLLKDGMRSRWPN